MRRPEALPPDIAQLLQRGAPAAEPPSGVRERLRSRLSTALANPVPSPVAQLHPVASATGTGFLAGPASSRLYLGVLAGFVVGAASMWAWRGMNSVAVLAPAPVVTTSIPETAPSLAVTGQAKAPSIPAPLAADPHSTGAGISAGALGSRPTTYRAVRKARPEAAPAGVSSQAAVSAPIALAPAGATPTHWGLLAEGELLQKGRTAMVRGDTEGALAAVDEHANRFPHGKLVEERQALKIQVLVAEDRTPEARAALGAFEREYPRSLLGPALEQAVVGRIQ